MISKRLIKKGFSELRTRGLRSFLYKAKTYFISPTKGLVDAEIKDWKKKQKRPIVNISDSEEIKGLVSVIIPIYDRTKELQESIESILSQTYQKFEMILVTDGSPEETMEMVESYRENPKIKIFHFYDNSGNAVRGRNKGIREARGEFIAFQDSDDIAEPERLQKSVAAANKSKADVVHGGIEVISDGKRNDAALENGEISLPKDFSFEDLLKRNQIWQGAVMARSAAIRTVGGLKTKMKYREDYELWLRLFYNGFSFKAIPEVLSRYRLHQGNNELNFNKDDSRWYELALQEYKKNAKLVPKIAYIIPGTAISGGVAVILEHSNRLLQAAYDVLIISQDLNESIDWFPDQKVPVVSLKNPSQYIFENIDILIATGWTTAPTLMNLKGRRKIYFVQSDERRFYEDRETKKIIEETYRIQCEYMTEAKWIRKWLKEEFGHGSYYVPNGLDEKIFHRTEPIEPKSGKSRILIEGRIDLPYKGVKESYEAIKDLDCEIWLVTSGGEAPEDWRVDKVFKNVPIEKMKEIYSSCDIFLKMSRIEGFFGPPMEAMACGCAVVVGKVTGYDEYIKNEYNALVVEQGDIEGAKRAIERLMDEKELRNKLIENGYETAKQWSWEKSIENLEEVIRKS